MEDHASDVVKVCLPFSSINKFIDKQFENSRLLTEGESVYEAKHVVVCSVKDQKDDEVTLAALVLQTSAISKDPHEIEVSIKGREVAAASCTCKAGQHKCKHLVALLLHINARETFSVLSATDLPQQWGKAQKAGVKEKYQPRKIVDLPSSKRAKKEHVQLPEGDILKRLLHGLPYIPSALSHSERRSAHASTSTASCSLSETSCTTAKETCCQARQEQIPSTETDVVLACSTLPMIIPDAGKAAVAAGASSAEDAHVQTCSTRPPTIAEAAKAAVAAGALSTEDMSTEDKIYPILHNSKPTLRSG